MSISKLPGGRFRCQIYDPATGRNVSAAKVLGLDIASWGTKREAKAVRELARARIREQQADGITVRAWAQTWTTDPLYQRPKESTNVTNRSAIRAFVDEYGHLPLADVDKRIVAAWLKGGKRTYQIQSLSVMFSDAMSLKAGELIDRNPWANLGVTRGTGNRHKEPPTVEQVDAMLTAAGERVSPYFQGWLTVACFTGMRPGEVDALRWTSVDLEASRVHVREQFSAQSGTFTLPKNGKARTILLPPRARETLLALSPSSEFCFTNFKGRHYSKSGRTYPWAEIKHTVDGRSLYLSSRHFAGWYMVNVLDMDSEDVAFQLGHEDGGELVRRLYGHRDRRRGIARLEQAWTAHDQQALKVIKLDDRRTG